MSQVEKQSTLGEIGLYSAGEVAYSVLMNSIFGFMMLFYSQVLGLPLKMVGLAMSIGVFWDALSDPIMGFISDNTRFKYGRRHIYIALGGVAMVLTYIMIWQVPSFIDSKTMVFWYAVAANLLFRTALTVSFVPFLALGFEICTEYASRSKLQSFRFVMNMAANVFLGTITWSWFFRSVDGVEGTTVGSNYIQMAFVFAAVSIVFLAIVIAATRKHITDTRDLPRIDSNGLRSFYREMREIFADKLSFIVFVFFTIASVGLVVMASMQAFVYIHFMKFASVERTIAQNATCVGMALGSVLSSWLAKKVEKRTIAISGLMLNIVSNALLWVIFMVPLLGTDVKVGFFGWQAPVSLIVFCFFQLTYWIGNGFIIPTSFSMIADISEINKCKTGMQKDGGYSAVFSLIGKAATSFAIFIVGVLLDMVGFDSEAKTQPAEVVGNMFVTMLLAGIGGAVLGMLFIWRYPVTRAYLDQWRNKAAFNAGNDSAHLDAETN